MSANLAFLNAHADSSLSRILMYSDLQALPHMYGPQHSDFFLPSSQSLAEETMRSTASVAAAATTNTIAAAVTTTGTAPSLNLDQNGFLAPDPRNLIVNYIPTPVTDADLKKLFDPFGEVESARVIHDKFTGQPKGYGFVRYVTHESAHKAVQEMNGYRLQNKRLKVTPAKGPANQRASAYYGNSNNQSGGSPTMQHASNNTPIASASNVVFTAVDAVPHQYATQLPSVPQQATVLAQLPLSQMHNITSYQFNPNSMPLNAHNMPLQSITHSSPGSSLIMGLPHQTLSSPVGENASEMGFGTHSHHPHQQHQQTLAGHPFTRIMGVTSQSGSPVSTNNNVAYKSVGQLPCFNTGMLVTMSLDTLNGTTALGSNSSYSASGQASLDMGINQLRYSIDTSAKQ